MAVTMQKRASQKPDGLTFDQIAEYVKNPDAFERVKAELLGLIEMSETVIADANTKASRANELMEKALQKEAENVEREGQLSARQQRMDEDEAARKAEHSKLTADLNGQIAAGRQATEAAVSRELAADQRESSATAAIARANREAEASNKERLRYMAMHDELRAVLAKHG